MNVDPEWLHVALSCITAIAVGFNVIQSTRIKLAISDLKLWTHEHFIGKNDYPRSQQLWRSRENTRQPQDRSSR